MAMSRIAVAALGLVAVHAAAEPPGAEPPAVVDDSLARYRQTFAPVSKMDCPEGAAGEIIVCGRPSWVPDPNRPPIPYPPVPGERTRLVLGEAPRATLSADACLPYQRCGNGGISIMINVFAIPSLVGKVVERIQDE
jgi:hypothetical protein